METTIVRRVLLVGCPAVQQAILIKLLGDRSFSLIFTESINVAIEMLNDSVIIDKKFQKVVTVSHLFEKEDGEFVLRLGSEIASKCFKTSIPCLVLPGAIENQKFLDAAKRAGATKIFEKVNWEEAIMLAC
jgi:hypothetical protein